MAPLGTGLGLEGAASGGPLLGLPDAAEMIKPIKLEQTEQTDARPSGLGPGEKGHRGM